MPLSPFSFLVDPDPDFEDNQLFALEWVGLLKSNACIPLSIFLSRGLIDF